MLYSKNYQTERVSWQVGCIANKKKGMEKRKMRDIGHLSEGDLPFQMNSALACLCLVGFLKIDGS